MHIEKEQNQNLQPIMVLCVGESGSCRWTASGGLVLMLYRASFLGNGLSQSAQSRIDEPAGE
jgi:hypothetical protein